jgi:hypothetical protein
VAGSRGLRLFFNFNIRFTDALHREDLPLHAMLHAFNSVDRDAILKRIARAELVAE